METDTFMIRIILETSLLHTRRIKDFIQRAVTAHHTAKGGESVDPSNRNLRHG
jgi:hypothetical protein